MHHKSRKHLRSNLFMVEVRTQLNGESARLESSLVDFSIQPQYAKQPHLPSTGQCGCLNYTYITDAKSSDLTF